MNAVINVLEDHKLKKKSNKKWIFWKFTAMSYQIEWPRSPCQAINALLIHKLKIWKNK